MKIAVLSDTHGKHGDIIEFPPADAFLFAGDFTNLGIREMSTIKSFNSWLGTLPYEHKIIIPGNHELGLEGRKDDMKELFTNAIYLDQEEYVINGVKVYGQPYSPTFGNWAYGAPEATLSDYWKAAPNDTRILLTHGPPFGYGDRNAWGEMVGSTSLTNFLEYENHNIEHVVCGHIHESAGIYTMQSGVKVWNASAVNLRIKLYDAPILLLDIK